MDCFLRNAAFSDGSLSDSRSRWPRDSHGDILRKLEEGGFDFARPALIDFSIQFQPRLPHHLLKRLCRDYPSLAFCITQGDSGNYLEFQVYGLVSYELVTNTLNHVTELMTPFEGTGSTWGVVLANLTAEQLWLLELGVWEEQTYLM